MSCCNGCADTISHWSLFSSCLWVGLVISAYVVILVYCRWAEFPARAYISPSLTQAYFWLSFGSLQEHKTSTETFPTTPLWCHQQLGTLTISLHLDSEPDVAAFPPWSQANSSGRSPQHNAKAFAIANSPQSWFPFWVWISGHSSWRTGPGTWQSHATWARHLLRYIFGVLRYIDWVI